MQETNRNLVIKTKHASIVRKKGTSNMNAMS